MPHVLKEVKQEPQQEKEVDKKEEEHDDDDYEEEEEEEENEYGENDLANPNFFSSRQFLKKLDLETMMKKDIIIHEQNVTHSMFARDYVTLSK